MGPGTTSRLERGGCKGQRSVYAREGRAWGRTVGGHECGGGHDCCTTVVGVNARAIVLARGYQCLLTDGMGTV